MNQRVQDWGLAFSFQNGVKMEGGCPTLEHRARSASPISSRSDTFWTHSPTSNKGRKEKI